MSSPISDPQRMALDKLARVLPARWYLAGGAAVAAHLHHRTSRDLDLFGDTDPTPLLPALEGIQGMILESRAPGTVHLRLDGLPVSLIEYRYPLLEPVVGIDLAVPVAALIDPACMKVSAIAGRGAARDFWDLDASSPLRGRRCRRSSLRFDGSTRSRTSVTCCEASFTSRTRSPRPSHSG